MTRRKQGKSTTGKSATYYNPFSNWQHFVIRIGELFMDVVTELHLRFFRATSKPDRKILGVWDFNRRAGTIGDFLTFLQNLSVLRSNYKLKGKNNIDICFVDDNSINHVHKKIMARPMKWKKILVNMAHLTPYLGSIHYFKSEKEFKRFYTANRKRYYRWPVTVSMSIPSQMPLVVKYEKETGKIPPLVLGVDIMKEIYSFYEDNIFPAKPIVLNFRKNIRSVERNSDTDALKKFLKHYEGSPRYKFIIICNKEEILDDFRKLKNVLFSRDYFPTLEHDYALIRSAYISIFPSSGMANFAWFSRSPFIQYGKHVGDPYSAPQKGEFFNEKYQKFIHKTEGPWMVNVFEEIAEYLKIHNINKTKENYPEEDGAEHSF